MIRFTKKILLDITSMYDYYLEVGRVLDIAYNAADFEVGKKEVPEDLPFNQLIYNVIDVNRCFVKSINLKEPLIQRNLLRLQIQNAIFLYGELLEPTKVLRAIYYNNRQLNQLPVKQGEIMNAINKDYPDIKIEELWRYGCKFVHPSYDNWKNSVIAGNLYFLQNNPIINWKDRKNRERLNKMIKEYKSTLKEMGNDDFKYLFKVNKLIIDICKRHIKYYTDIIKTDKDKAKYYKYSLKMVQAVLPT